MVVGAGQSGLALGYHLWRHNRDVSRHGRRPLDLVLLDARDHPGGAWRDGWDSLRLFSPAAFSSLPGHRMPSGAGGAGGADGANPPASAVVDYLTDYERRYDLPVRHGVRVTAVHRDKRDEGVLRLDLDDGSTLATRHLVNATGTWEQPFVPAVRGAGSFGGRQLHVVDHRRPSAYAGESVLVVGGGNSGAQVTADLLQAQERAREQGGPAPDAVHWVTTRAPCYLADDVDGRVLFETATQALADRAAGREARGVASLGDIVATPAVRHARDDLGMTARVGLTALTAHGARFADGEEVRLDTVVWATGFRPALRHLRHLDLAHRDGRPETTGASGAYPTRSASDPDVWFLGYGDWCGPASATLIGVGRAARDTAEGLVGSLTEAPSP
ncbi:NAD(P)/FAD-dependent oxidoreductase [Nocardioidaceae bacterium]|nr:NAD(P)/FAD-dependent oxidoreductase [Nocardioidaceae bacterium]